MHALNFSNKVDKLTFLHKHREFSKQFFKRSPGEMKFYDRLDLVRMEMCSRPLPSFEAAHPD